MKYLIILLLSFSAYAQKDLSNKDITCSDYNSLNETLEQMKKDLNNYDPGQTTHQPAIRNLEMNMGQLQSNITDVEAIVVENIEHLKQIKPSYDYPLTRLKTDCSFSNNAETNLSDLVIIAATELDNEKLKSCREQLNLCKSTLKGQVVDGQNLKEEFQEIKPLKNHLRNGAMPR